MNTKVFLLLIMVMAALLAASSAHAEPAEQVVISALPPLCETIGEVHAVKCKKNPIVKGLGCDDMKPPPLYWGGLKPYLPMAICMNFRGSVKDQYVRRTGCIMAVNERYVALLEKKGEHTSKLLTTQEEFRKFFAPVEDGPEALSYITALTGSYPVYEFSKKYFIHSLDEDGGYVVKNPKPTEVWEKKDGFHVRLFDHVRCGCHRPELFAIEYVVTKDGYVTQKKKKTVWQAGRHYNICVD